MGHWLTITGLVLTLIGAGLGACGVRVTWDQAIEIGVMRWSGKTKQENLQLPAVQNLIRKSWLAQIGFRANRGPHGASNRRRVARAWRDQCTTRTYLRLGKPLRWLTV
jgi:hypothetical protein